MLKMCGKCIAFPANWHPMAGASGTCNQEAIVMRPDEFRPAPDDEKLPDLSDLNDQGEGELPGDLVHRPYVGDVPKRSDSDAQAPVAPPSDPQFHGEP